MKYILKQMKRLSSNRETLRIVTQQTSDFIYDIVLQGISLVLKIKIISLFDKCLR